MGKTVIIGTTEAAYLLDLCCQRVRQLLKAGRIQGAKKVNGFWQIPLFKGMPKVKKGHRGPQGTWNKRQQQVVNYICVNQHKIRKNKKENNRDEKVILLKRGQKTHTECHYVEFNGPAKVVYQPGRPLNCGATVWIEVDPTVQLSAKCFSNAITT